jgi:protein ImuA
MVAQQDSTSRLPDENRSTAIQELRSSLRTLQQRVRLESCGKDVISTGTPGLDAILPDQGLPRGTLSEWIAAEPGSGVASLAVRVAGQAQRDGPLILVDTHRHFYTPAFIAAGLQAGEVILVRPTSRAHELWTIEQSLKCSGIGAVFCTIDYLKTQEFRRLQLAAESGTAIGLLLRPATASRQSGWANVRLLVSPRASPPQSLCRRVNVRCLYARGGLTNRTVELDICDETGAVCLAAGFSDSAVE